MPEPAGRPTPQDHGRARLRAALLRPSRGQLVVGVLLALLGFAAVTQMRSTDVHDSFAGYREQDLIDVLSGLAGTSQRAQAEINRLEATRDQLESDTSARQAALSEAQKEADALSILAGVVPVTGPGLRITITEKEGQVSVNTLVDMIQELRTSGAEAMQFNGEVRVIAQTAISPGIGGVIIDGVQLEAPYVVDVIGEPHTLRGGMTFLQGPRSQIEDDGGEVRMQDVDSMDIESVREPKRPEFAQPGPGA